jgi:hypothetical protein
MIHDGINITPLLTTQDRGMQEQAFLTEQLWLSTPNASRGIIENIWRENYTISLQNMQKALATLDNLPGTEASQSILEDIIVSIHHTQNAIHKSINGITAIHQLFSHRLCNQIVTLI